MKTMCVTVETLFTEDFTREPRQGKWIYAPSSGATYTNDCGRDGTTVGIWYPLVRIMSKRRPQHISALCKRQSAMSTFAMAFSSFLRARSLYRQYFFFSLFAFCTRRSACIGFSMDSGYIWVKYQVKNVKAPTKGGGLTSCHDCSHISLEDIGKPRVWFVTVRANFQEPAECQKMSGW